MAFIMPRSILTVARAGWIVPRSILTVARTGWIVPRYSVASY